MTEELLQTLSRDPLAFALQAYMLGFLLCAAAVLLTAPVRRWLGPTVRARRD